MKRKLNTEELNFISGGVIKRAVWADQLQKTKFRRNLINHELEDINALSYVVNRGRYLVWFGNNLNDAISFDWDINQNEYRRGLTESRHRRLYKRLYK